MIFCIQRNQAQNHGSDCKTKVREQKEKEYKIDKKKKTFERDR